MGLPAVSKKGVKCTYFVLRKDSLLGHSDAANSLTPLPQPIPGSAKLDDGRQKTSESKQIPRERTLLQPSDTSDDGIKLEFGRTCKHMIPQPLGDWSSNCEFCRGEKLVEEAARNNDDLVAEEETDDLSLEQHSGGLPDELKENPQPGKKLKELPLDVGSKMDAKLFRRLWRTLCSPAAEPPLANQPLVLASVRLGKISSQLLVYNPPKSKFKYQK